jgi:hypothetical protein
LHVVTDKGWLMATRFSVLTAAKRRVGLLLDRNIWSTVMAWTKSLGVARRKEQMALAAS